VVISAELD